jgi:hypothetical protein
MIRPIYTSEELPEDLYEHPSIFLVGPTPRDGKTKSWRPEALELLKGFDGWVFVPEYRPGYVPQGKGDFFSLQCEWERAGLKVCDAIAAWVPREIKKMPAFTTNVEFGLYVTSERFVYGRPKGAPKTRYLDWLYKSEHEAEPHDSLESLLKNAVEIADENFF